MTFCVSGMLWHDSLVMLDQETRSKWSHLLGEAMAGPLVGEVLQPLPSLMTDWATWKARHPDTTVVMLERTTVNFRREMYDLGYRVVIGLALNGQSRCWDFEDLRKQPVVNDQLANRRLVVLFDVSSSTANLFDRDLAGETLTFAEKDGHVVDQETGSTWELIRGRCVKGAFRGKHLTPLPGIVSFDHAWSTFHPTSTVWSPGK